MNILPNRPCTGSGHIILICTGRPTLLRCLCGSRGGAGRRAVPLPAEPAPRRLLLGEPTGLVQPVVNLARTLVPQSQVYLVGIEINDPDGAICPGVLGQVKVHCEYRSCAWWIWRALSATFDLGLL